MDVIAKTEAERRGVTADNFEVRHDKEGQKEASIVTLQYLVWAAQRTVTHPLMKRIWGDNI